MKEESSQSQEEPRIGKSIVDDVKGFFKGLKAGGLKKVLSRDYQEAKETFLSEERNTRLETMGKIKAGFYLFFWFLKSLYLRLALYRRLLLLLGIILIMSIDQNASNSRNVAVVGAILLLYVLLLELKDKILARSELETGRSVQRALMPEQKPAVPGWSVWLFTRPANDVGGDLIDFLRLEEDKYGIALGDLAGKGLGAALSMAKLQATIRALAPDRGGLAEFGGKINRIYYRDRVPNSFASVVYLELQANAGRAGLINAGHMPPIVVTSGGIRELERGGAALGILPDAKYAIQEIALSENEFILAYSDGLTEARDETGQFFGDERLFTALPELYGRSAEAIGTHLVDMIEKFVGDAPTHDDISLAIMMRNGSHERVADPIE